MKNESFIDRKIPVKFLFILFPIMILQLLLPVRKIALFLIDDLNIPFELLLITENLTASISVLILCLFLIQILKWKWLSKKAFSIGFVSIFFLNLLFSIFDEIFNLKPPIFIEIFYEWSFTIFLPIGYFLTSFYKGWGFWSTLGLNVAVSLFIIFPTIGGILFSPIYAIYKKNKQ